MYVKIFESRETACSYIIMHQHSLTVGAAGKMYISNEKHDNIEINEGELFNLIDRFFRNKLNERENEERRKNDGQED
jgi:hypothetical protein